MIFAKHLPALATFYQNAFDLVPEAASDRGWLLLRSRTGVGIALHALPAQIADQIEIASPARLREEAFLKACFEVNSLAAQCERIRAHGGQTKEPWEWQGTRFCECADPEGNVLRIFERS